MGLSGGKISLLRRRSSHCGAIDGSAANSLFALVKCHFPPIRIAKKDDNESAAHWSSISCIKITPKNCTERPRETMKQPQSHSNLLIWRLVTMRSGFDYAELLYSNNHSLEN